MTEPAPASAPQGLLQRLPAYTVPAILLGVPLLAYLLVLLTNGSFYDHVIWKYYWGPIKADAFGETSLTHNGVAASAGYNIVNTLSWAVLLGLCIVGASQIIEALRVKMDNTLILGATAWVVTGAVWHVLEDTDLLARPLQYFFITPPIYLLFAAFGILAILTGVYMDRVSREKGLDAALQSLWLILSLGVLAYFLAWLADWGQVVAYVHPAAVALFAALAYFVVRLRVVKAGRVKPNEVVLILPIFPMLMAIAYVLLFLDSPWHPRGAGLPSAMWLAPGLAAGLTAVVFAIARWRNGATKSETSAAFLVPINLVLVFSQLVDAFATSLGLDLAGYEEKHVLSAFIIDAFRSFAQNIGWGFGATHPTFLAFVPVKLLVSILVVWAIDVYSKEDAKKYPTLIGFVKFAIIMVGIGPGVRDFVRLALGV